MTLHYFPFSAIVGTQGKMQLTHSEITSSAPMVTKETQNLQVTVEAIGGGRRHLWDRLDNRFLVTLPRDQNVSILHRVQMVS